MVFMEMDESKYRLALDIVAEWVKELMSHGTVGPYRLWEARIRSAKNAKRHLDETGPTGNAPLGP